jgi:thiol-disulfide isomerase/thioredoxin
MNFIRKHSFSIALLLFMAVVLFTPAGFYLKVYANRLLSHNPTPVPERQQQLLEDYDWNLLGRDGIPYNMEADRGNVLFINFWASWCPPCVAEMPGMQELYNDYASEVRFLFVARDKRPKVEAFLEKNRYELPVFFERGLTPRQIYYGGLPTTFIIDKKGKIVVSKVGSADWNSIHTRKLLDSLLLQ